MALKLDTIVQTGANTLPPRVCVYGPQAIGKTSFAAQFKNSIGLLAEDGVGNLDFPRVMCHDYNTLTASIDALLVEDHGYRTVFIDSLDWTEQKLWKHLCEEHGKINIEDFGYGKGFQFALAEWAKLLAKLDQLREKRKMLVLLIGHSIVKTFNPPDSESYDRYRLDLHEKAASLILDWLDVLAFATYRVPTRESADGKRRLAVGDSERVLYTEERPAFWAKNRYSMPFELPLSQSAFVEALRKGRGGNDRNGKKNEEPKSGQSHSSGEAGADDNLAGVN